MTAAPNNVFGPTESRKILIVAGEASGDLHGANLVRAIRGIRPDTSFAGIGGNRLRDAGVELLAHCSEMGVVGLTEVVSKLKQILGVHFRLKAIIRQARPDLVILIDYPDFNIPLARAASKAGVPVFYYISPQVWAWRRGRIRQLKKVVTRMAVILPFEQDVYRQEGMHVDFVGHPLLDVIDMVRQESSGEMGAARKGGFRIGILPGSRRGEVEALLPDMLRAAEILQGKMPGKISFFLPLADTLVKDDVARHIEESSVKVDIISGGAYGEISSADAAMVASGTATLETALLGTPLVVLYRVSPLTYMAGKCLIRVKCISLVNIIAGRVIVPELIQRQMSPERIAAEISSILGNPAKAAGIRADLRELRERLGSPGASARAARIACELLH